MDLRNYIYVPVCLYSITGSMIMPVVQSMIYEKVCLLLSNETGIYDCVSAVSAASKNQRIQTESNRIVLIASICICLAGVLTSRLIGHVSDKKSRKLSMLIPFVGLLLADITLLLQAVYFKSTPYLFPLSELVFGCFGGYMAILSTSFAYITTKPGITHNERSKSIARLEGALGVGGIVGFLLSSQLRRISYINTFLFFIIVHLICFFYIAQMKSYDSTSTRKDTADLKVCSDLLVSRGKSCDFRLLVCYIAFGASYFALVGSSHILFFYLKQRFYWDAEYYGYLRALTQFTSTAMALFIYPLCKSHGVRDATLVLIGLIARGLGRAWLAIAWNGLSVFAAVPFEMFARFPATGLRSLISSNVQAEERGSAFAVVAILEGVCKLAAAIIFHLLFPWSISFMPQLSFVLMAVLILPPTLLFCYYKEELEKKDDVTEEQKTLNTSTSTEENNQ
ncbi:unnamed protein product [Cylicocyclus nassatus]|uniref:Proton-coupled folate transporter n=1 Tax=Cylicocyclus nassatus TaxID=53992 RepID=A0AA36DQ31_CYLNA|nr:unnamed protein product [Cylicocyclus nassatus]